MHLFGSSKIWPITFKPKPDLAILDLLHRKHFKEVFLSLFPRSFSNLISLFCQYPHAGQHQAMYLKFNYITLFNRVHFLIFNFYIGVIVFSTFFFLLCANLPLKRYTTCTFCLNIVINTF